MVKKSKKEKIVFNVRFGERVKYFRNLARLTQEELAERIDCEANTLSYIENGKNNISFSRLPKLCEALGIEPYQLFIYDYSMVDIDRIQKANKILKSLTDSQFDIAYKLLVGIANIKADDLHKSITQ